MIIYIFGFQDNILTISFPHPLNQIHSPFLIKINILWFKLIVRLSLLRRSLLLFTVLLDFMTQVMKIKSAMTMLM